MRENSSGSYFSTYMKACSTEQGGNIMQIKENKVVDVCAEQIKTIDQCRWERYQGNVGSEGVKQVNRA